MTAARVVWHDVENGSYEADLPLWRELAEQADGAAVLDLGAGTGRVSIDLAARGHQVVALDSDPELLAELADRARSPAGQPAAHGPGVTTVEADARSFTLDARFALVIAPMQLVQIVGGPAGRAAMLERVHAHLEPGGSFAAALTEARHAPPDGEPSPPFPDIVERDDGWVFSSQAVSVRQENGRVLVERRRQAVSPRGELDESTAVIALDVLEIELFESEARAAGLEPVERRDVPETPDHIGSTVVVCRR